jgi:UDP-2,3-diacylglucosamine pyrophosphatase LpxH
MTKHSDHLAGRRTDVEATSPRRWRSMWLSDVQLGAGACRGELLLGLLQHFHSEHLYLVGDVVAGPRQWDVHRWDPVHGEVLRALVERARADRVVYVTGPDDGFVRRDAGRALGGVHVREESVHATADGRELLVTNAQRATPDATGAGTRPGLLERGVELVRAAVSGHEEPPPALAADALERALADEARRRGLDGVICGHVRRAGIRDVDGILFCNSGDWIESCTALVEDVRGKLALLRLSALGARFARAGSG